MKKVNLIQGTNEWKQYRKDKIGGSDIASIIDAEGAYRSSKVLLREKLGEDKPLTEFQVNLFQTGHDTEEQVRTFLKTNGFDFVPMVIEHKDNPRFFGSFDGICEKSGMALESKYTTREEIAEMVRSSIIPEVYNAQIQWLLEVSELNECMLVVIKDEKFITAQVKRDQVFIDKLKDAAADFLVEMDAGKESKHLADPDYMKLINLKLAESHMKAQMETVTDEIKSLSEKLLNSYQANQLEGGGIRVEYIERIGTVNYKKIPELEGVDLEKYRGKPTKYTQAKLLKGEV